MITFFRKALSSWMVLGLFGLILIAFIVTGFGAPTGMESLSLAGDKIAKAGSQSLSASEAAQRLQSQYEGARRETPGLTMSAFLASGRFDATIEQMVNGRALDAFAEDEQMAISDRLVDSEIAKIAAFKGATGKFDRTVFLAVLSERRINEADLRADIARDMMADKVIIPASGGAVAPVELIAPYANLLLETRFGQQVVLPWSRFAPTAHGTEAQIKDFYSRNAARYTVPETRTVKYAVVDNSRFAGKVQPTEAEIADAYKVASARFAASEKRVLTQAIVQSEAAAKAMAAKVAGGEALSVAAKAAGVEATTLKETDKKAYAALASEAVANAVFTTAQGKVAAPAKSGLGWHVVKVDTITAIPGKSLEQARAELMPILVAQKEDAALADFVSGLEDAVADGQAFDDVAKAQGLTVVSTPAVTQGGLAPGNAAFKPASELALVLKDAFTADLDDDPATVTIERGKRYAFYDVAAINAAAPKPLAEIRAQVASDLAADTASRAARKAAQDAVARVNKGESLASVLAAMKLPAAAALGGQRLEMEQAGEKAPAGLRTLFDLTRGQAKSQEDKAQQAYRIVALERIIPGNAKARPDLISATQGELSRVLGDEYAQQMLGAIRKQVGTTQNAEAIARLKASLKGTAGQ